jgi:hypothetical protein
MMEKFASTVLLLQVALFRGTSLVSTPKSKYGPFEVNQTGELREDQDLYLNPDPTVQFVEIRFPGFVNHDRNLKISSIEGQIWKE